MRSSLKYTYVTSELKLITSDQLPQIHGNRTSYLRAGNVAAIKISMIDSRFAFIITPCYRHRHMSPYEKEAIPVWPDHYAITWRCIFLTGIVPSQNTQLMSRSSLKLNSSTCTSHKQTVNEL
ncbi:hypothetical protein CC80DRAFT_276143 [Byssothecium circinans]|uniref:Uncharacterized protein n=1 Tax=Byssothecium circinans TaxID=147558 RepID=A0A6A5TAH6_9PLEO|nr:hypothetical protein CC80DRAFT_276143 [Byssothecium circinans]